MKREIKFRGLALPSGNWVFGSLITGNYPTFEGSTQIYNGGGFTIVDPKTVGQFTGKVVNGKDLYEDDIITWEEEDDDYPLAWIEWEPEDGKFWVESDAQWGGYLSEFENIKVVGNIHQHKGMLAP